MIAKQASARHFWVFLSTNFVFRRLAKEGRKIGDFRDKNARKVLYTYGTWYFVYLPWIDPSWEQRLPIGAQAMYIAYNDTSVIVINFQKIKDPCYSRYVLYFNFGLTPPPPHVCAFGRHTIVNTFDELQMSRECSPLPINRAHRYTPVFRILASQLRNVVRNLSTTVEKTHR